MPTLSPARRRANSARRANLNAEIKRLKQYYSGSFTGQLGRTATRRTMNNINNMIKELAARRIQKAVRAHQAYARAHARNRAPLNLVMAAAYNPSRVARLRKQYGMRANNF